jgi:hypothetical protein
MDLGIKELYYKDAQDKFGEAGQDITNSNSSDKKYDTPKKIMNPLALMATMSSGNS